MSQPRQPSPVSDFGIRICFGFRPKTLLFALAISLALDPSSLLACATCYGQSDAPMAQGMNWGILTLLATVIGVLAAFVVFFVYLARKAATAAPTQPGRASVPASPDFLFSPHQLGLARTLALPTDTEPLLESRRSLS